MFTPRIIKEGEAVIAWKGNGTRTIIEGPKIHYGIFEKIYPLQQACAREDQYLVIKFVDGRTEHREGPYHMWIDPLLHADVAVRHHINLDTHEAVVIYDDNEGTVERRVLHGPATYTPRPTEWLHQFRWHGDNGKGKKVPRALNFEKLRVIPDQLYFDVDNVRTGDEALITVQLMVFFELNDIDKMLAQTHDPIADFINALTADIIKFAGQCDFETFKVNAKNLNDLDQYPELVNRAKRIGYNINKVVYRGYVANPRLQQMHNEAIETRTKLVLETEAEEQQQQLADLKLDRQHQRATQERDEQQKELTHTLEQQQREQQQTLAQQKKIKQLELEQLQNRAQLELEINENTLQLERDNKAKLLALKFEEWQHLGNHGADLTAIMVAREKNPDKTIRIDQDAPGAVHLHEAV